MEYQYPSILRRYFATFIDGMLVIGALILVSYLFQSDDKFSVGSRVAIIIFMFFVYEPICTSKFCTLGQMLTSIRVRTLFLRDKISIPSAYFRIAVKIFLGVFSFFTIPYTKNKRAIHDFAAGTVVIYKKPLIS